MSIGLQKTYEKGSSHTVPVHWWHEYFQEKHLKAKVNQSYSCEGFLFLSIWVKVHIENLDPEIL